MQVNKNSSKNEFLDHRWRVRDADSELHLTKHDSIKLDSIEHDSMKHYSIKKY